MIVEPLKDWPLAHDKVIPTLPDKADRQWSDMKLVEMRVRICPVVKQVVIVYHELWLLFWYFINTKAYHYEPLSPST